MSLIAILRVRGSMETRGKLEVVMKQNHLTRKNHMILIQSGPQTTGFLHVANDWITYGEVSEKVVEKLFRERGEVIGGKRLTDEFLSKNSKYKTISDYAKHFFEGTANFKEVENLKPLFRLHHPIKGFERLGIKQRYPKGALGNRKEKINDLILRML